MEKIWAPWRVDYVSKIAKKPRGCVFCSIVKEKNDTKNFIFKRSKHCYAVLNIFPYNNGHVLIVPFRHVAELSDLKKEEKEDLFSTLELTQKLLKKKLKPQGFNIGINIGKFAGAGFPDHIHIHIVPRWKGDVNFMPVTGNTKIISQSLKSLYRLLKNA